MDYVLVIGASLLIAFISLLVLRLTLWIVLVLVGVLLEYPIRGIRWLMQLRQKEAKADSPNRYWNWGNYK